jgi:hypothetical protein
VLHLLSAVVVSIYDEALHKKRILLALGGGVIMVTIDVRGCIRKTVYSVYRDSRVTRKQELIYMLCEFSGEVCYRSIVRINEPQPNPPQPSASIS